MNENDILFEKGFQMFSLFLVRQEYLCVLVQYV